MTRDSGFVGFVVGRWRLLAAQLHGERGGLVGEALGVHEVFRFDGEIGVADEALCRVVLRAGVPVQPRVINPAQIALGPREGRADAPLDLFLRLGWSRLKCRRWFWGIFDFRSLSLGRRLWLRSLGSGRVGRSRLARRRGGARAASGVLRAGSAGRGTGSGGSDSLASMSRGGGAGISRGGPSTIVFALGRAHALPRNASQDTCASTRAPTRRLLCILMPGGGGYGTSSRPLVLTVPQSRRRASELCGRPSRGQSHSRALSS